MEAFNNLVESSYTTSIVNALKNHGGSSGQDMSNIIASVQSANAGMKALSSALKDQRVTASQVELVGAAINSVNKAVGSLQTLTGIKAIEQETLKTIMMYTTNALVAASVARKVVQFHAAVQMTSLDVAVLKTLAEIPVVGTIGGLIANNLTSMTTALAEATTVGEVGVAEAVPAVESMIGFTEVGSLAESLDAALVAGSQTGNVFAAAAEASAAVEAGNAASLVAAASGAAWGLVGAAVIGGHIMTIRNNQGLKQTEETLHGKGISENQAAYWRAVNRLFSKNRTDYQESGARGDPNSVWSVKDPTTRNDILRYIGKQLVGSEGWNGSSGDAHLNYNKVNEWFADPKNKQTLFKDLTAEVKAVPFVQVQTDGSQLVTDGSAGNKPIGTIIQNGDSKVTIQQPIQQPIQEPIQEPKQSSQTPTPKPVIVPPFIPKRIVPKPTETPAIAKPSAPVVAKPSVPVIAKPSVPVIAKPSVPVIAKPSSPVVAKPSSPVVAKPSAPVIATPTQTIRTSSPYDQVLSDDSLARLQEIKAQALADFEAAAAVNARLIDQLSSEPYNHIAEDVPNRYSQETARALFCWSSAVYDNSNSYHDRLAKYSPITIEKNGLRVLLGFDNHELVVAWRGTASIQNVITDISAFSAVPPGLQLMPPLAPLLQDNITRIHSGFFAAYLSLRSEVLQFWFQHRRPRMYITGHSLGNALANIMSLEVDACQVYGFGGPAFCDETLAEIIDKRSEEEGPHACVTWMVRNKGDPIPLLPGAIGYAQLNNFCVLHSNSHGYHANAHPAKLGKLPPDSLLQAEARFHGRQEYHDRLKANLTFGLFSHDMTNFPGLYRSTDKGSFDLLGTDEGLTDLENVLRFF